MLSRLTILIIAIICTAFGLQAMGQANIRPQLLQLQFAPVLGSRPLVLDEAADASDTRISTFRCYISGLSLWHNGQLIWQEPDSYHLIDAAEPSSLLLHMNVPGGIDYNAIRFNLGIDSATSCSGAHGGELDPVKGMYWAWQSGYINFKLEGSSPQCPTRKHTFHFHLGGYQYPYAAIQPIRLVVKPSDAFVIRIDLAQFLSGLDLSKQNAIMIPGEEASRLSAAAAAIFKIQP